jgi:hypothetical protein
MENLLFFIIAALVFIVKIRAGMKEYKEQRPEREEDDALSPRPLNAPPPLQRGQTPPPAGSPTPPPRPRPTLLPPHPLPQNLPQLFDELLGVERSDDGERELPLTRAAAPPAPTPASPQPISPPTPLSSAPPTAPEARPTLPRSAVPTAPRSAVLPAERRRYLAPEDIAPPPAVTPSASLNTADLMAQNLAQAFPAAMQQLRSLRMGDRAPIRVRVGGRPGLRQAVIMAEVLQRPRAYDL